MKRILAVLLAAVVLMLCACAYDEAFLQRWEAYNGDGETAEASTVPTPEPTSEPTPPVFQCPITPGMLDTMRISDEDLGALLAYWPLDDHPMAEQGTLTSFLVEAETDDECILWADFVTDKTLDEFAAAFAGYDDDAELSEEEFWATWHMPEGHFVIVSIDNDGAARNVSINFILDGLDMPDVSRIVDEHWPEGLEELTGTMDTEPPSLYGVNLWAEFSVEYTRGWVLPGVDEAKAKLAEMETVLLTYDEDCYVTGDCLISSSVERTFTVFRFDNEIEISVMLNDDTILADYEMPMAGANDA